MDVKKSYIIIKYIILISLILSICAVGFFSYRTGLIIDEYGTLCNGKNISHLWWLSLVFSFGMFFVMEYLYNPKNIKHSMKNTYRNLSIFLHIVWVLSILFSIYTVINMNLQIGRTIQLRKEAEMTKQQESVLDLISLEKFDEIISEKNTEATYNTMTIYVSRKDCPACITMDPIVRDFLVEKDMKALYYDTIQDREKRKEYMDKVLDKYKIDSVPTIIVIENGKVEQKFDGDTMLEDFEKFLIQ